MIQDNTISITLLMLACMSFGVYCSNHWAITQTLAGPLAAGRWTSIQNGVGNLSGIVAPWVTGVVVEKTGAFYLAFVVSAACCADWRLSLGRGGRSGRDREVAYRRNLRLTARRTSISRYSGRSSAHPPNPRRKPEIMSPAGYWPQLRAAIEAGADSVYFGLKHFSARAKVGFSIDELPDVFRTLHGRGVKGFMTFNTLVFEHELAEASRAIEAIAESGADALIVQDIGVMQLAHEIAPDLELHASTQMSITNADGSSLCPAAWRKARDVSS